MKRLLRAIGEWAAGFRGPAGLTKRTVLFVAVFGLGSLLVVAVLSSALTGIAEGVLPRAGASATATVGSAFEPAASASGRLTKPPMTQPGRRRTIPRMPASSDEPTGLGPTPGSEPKGGSSRSPSPSRPAYLTVPPRAQEAPPSAGEQPL